MSVFTINDRIAPVHAAPSLFKRVSASLQQVLITHRTQNVLVQMDDRLLADVGLSRAQAGYPVNRPIWDAGLR
jgi:uncharacterized protein YjiS (DUF1127 family)